MKFSNLVRYVFTGGFVAVIVLFILIINDIIEPWKDSSNILEGENGVISIMIMLLIAAFYFIGVIFSGVRLWLSKFDCFFYFYNSKLRFWGRLLFPYVMFDVNHLCADLKYTYKAHCNFPHWIYLVNRPDKLLDCMVDYTFKLADEDVDDEMRYMNETATTLIFILYLSLFAQLVAFGLTVDVNKLMPNLFAMIILAGLIVLLSVVAYTFAFKFLMKLGNMEKVCKDAKNILNMPFSIHEYPTAFILIRTTTKSFEENKKRNNDCLKDALCSVAMQDYPNIKVIVLDDVVDKKDSRTKEVIDAYKNLELKEERRKLSMSYDKGICNGAAGSAYHIRELFLTIASERDVAIMLDDDDTLKYNGAISDIMIRMHMCGADICLSSFETTEDLQLNICNKGGKTHNDIVKRLEKKAEVFSRKMVMASSIGWTKAYTYNQVKKYNDYILKTSINGEEAHKMYKALERYEDFPDILVLASSVDGKLPLITGVSTPTHNYTKRAGGITTTPNLDDFLKVRSQFLAFTLGLAFIAEKEERWKVSEENTIDVLRFVLFKTLQISNIIMGNKKKFVEENDTAWKDFNVINNATFYRSLCKALKKTVDVGILKVKLRTLIQLKDEDGKELSLDELMKIALEKIYKDNKEDIDIANLKK